MLPVQCKMARVALGLGTRELADLAKVSPDTVARFERGDVLKERTVDTLRSALEDAGAIFVAENGEGPGVRLKKGSSPAELTKRIEAIKEHLKDSPEAASADDPPSPARGMRLLERGHKAEVLKKLKSRRAKLEDKA